MTAPDFLLLIAGGVMYQAWMRDLDTVNQDSITFEEMVLRRIKD